MAFMMPKKTQKPAIVYARVSTALQAGEGVSLDMQTEKARQWAIMNGHTVEGVFVDAGLSGKKMENRPELQNALEAVCQCSGVLVVYSLSRLARSTAETILIAGKMVFRMLAVIAEFERDVIAERTKTVLNHKRDNGEVYNKLPLGFDRDGEKLIPNEAETQIVQKVFRLRKRGLSMQKIADRLNKDGHKGKNGGQFYAVTVQKILRNPLYATKN
jgi:DNA invertase Pin-like site-specific DNA recombinase